MEIVPGTQGYAEIADHFIPISESISFNELHHCVSDLIPTDPTTVLDLGSGSGRDAAALAKLGHSVVAVEPVSEFIESAKRTHPSENIEWVQDSLPNIPLLSPTQKFSFILCHGVWQHLDQVSRLSALKRISGLLTDGGQLALALRHGPAGQGTYYFPSDSEQTIIDAAKFDLYLVRRLENQPSVLPGKSSVVWTRLVFKKHGEMPNNSSKKDSVNAASS